MTSHNTGRFKERVKFLTKGVEKGDFTKGPDLFSYKPSSAHYIKLISGNLNAKVSYKKISYTQNGILMDNNYNLSYKIFPYATIGLTKKAYYLKGTWNNGIKADTTINTQGNIKGIFSWKYFDFYIGRIKEMKKAAATINILDTMLLTLIGAQKPNSSDINLCGNYFADLGGAFVSLTLSQSNGFCGRVSVKYGDYFLSTLVKSIPKESMKLFALGAQYNFFKDNYVRMMLDSDLIFGVKASAFISSNTKITGFIRTSTTTPGAPSIGVKISTTQDRSLLT